MATPFPITGAAIDNRGGEVGLAFFDAGRASLTLIQFIETARSRANVTAAVAAAAAARVLVVAPPHPDAAAPPSPGTLAAAVARAGATVVPAPRAAFDDGAGAAAVARVAVGGGVGDRPPYLALAAAAALLTHLADAHALTPAPASLTLTIKHPSSFIAIDAASAASLRLASSPPGTPSLLSSLDRTRTDAGRALLRANLLQPLAHAPTLAERHAAVAELARDTAAAAAVDAALRALPRDLDRMCGALALRPARRPGGGDGPAAVDAEAGALRAALRAARAAPALAATLAQRQAALFRGLAAALAHPELQELAEDLSSTLADDAALDETLPLDTRSAFAVRATDGGLLAAARAALAAAAAAAADEATRVRGLPGLKGARLQYTARQGFVLALPAGAADAAAAQRLTLLTPRRASTPALAALSSRAAAAKADCLTLSADALAAARGRVLTRCAALHRLVDAVALADVIASLAAAARAARGPVALPTLTTAGPLVITGLRCPLLEAGGVDAVPNDVCVGGGAPLAVITGPNSAGKTTLLRAVALAVVTAAVGGLPTARGVALPAVDRVCARAGAVPPDPARRASSFGVECADLATALTTATPSSIVILDEPGRGTSPRDGGALAWATCEALLAKRARALVATHHGVLGGLAAVYAGARLWHLDAVVEVAGQRPDAAPASLTPSWRLLPGPCPVRHYGLALAPAVGVPPAGAADAAAIASAAEAATAATVAAATATAPTAAVAARRTAVDTAHRVAALARAAVAGAPAAEIAPRLAALVGEAGAALAGLEAVES